MEGTEFVGATGGPLTNQARPPPRRVDESDDLNELAAALAKAQGSIRNAEKDSEADAVKYKYKYADLASVWDACRKPLSDNGLAVLQRARTTDDAAVVVTMLIHSSGQWVRDTLEFPVAQRTPQAYGSAITYARRYALSALVGVAADVDDDGAAASGGYQAQRQDRQERQERARPKEPPPKQEPKEEPKQSPALRARITKLWHASQRKEGTTTEQFQAWTAKQIGRQASSTEWTEEDVAKLEAAVIETTEAGSNG